MQMIELIQESVISNAIKSPRLFLYLGFGLILLALICFPARMWVVTQPETPEIELLWMGPFYALLIGLWSLPSLLLGVLESSMSRKVVLFRFTPILFLANIFLAGILWSQIGYGYWRGMEIQMLLNYSPFLIPCIIVDAVSLLYLTKNEKLANGLKNQKVRMLLAVVLASFPLLVAGYVFYYWWQTTPM